ncbi:MAG: GNAT family N-acetyltransferase [Bacteroidota bacterium]
MTEGKLIGEYFFSTDKTKLDLTYIHNYLSSESYWAKNIPIEVVQKSIDGSLCFGVYNLDRQVGFARVISDQATFAYLADVFIDKDHRGKNLSKELMKFVMESDFVKVIRRFMLATLDAHSLYEQFGFKALPDPQRMMGIKFFEEY